MTDNTGGKVFSVTKKIILAITAAALCMTTSQALADSDSVVVKRSGWTAISIPIILDKEEETTSRVLKMVSSLIRENEKRALKNQPLEKCDSNPILGRILSGFHVNIKKVFNEDIEKKGKFVYLFTTEDNYEKGDLISLLCRWPEE